MKLTLGFSPCPNDTFIFDALIHKKIDTGDLEFDVIFDDVETLNNKAFNNTLDITKLSYHAFAYAASDYELLDAGSALGFGVGPLLIANKNFDVSKLKTSPQSLKVGIPGKYTTANFLLGIAYPELQNKQEMLFSDIEQSLLEGNIDLGLIIHENRFTYQAKGLIKITDLGDYWEKETGCAIPLGGIVIKRTLPKDIKQQVNRLIAESVAYAFENPQSGVEFIKQYAQEMSEEVMFKHIKLYVNDYSKDLGIEGKMAIRKMFDIAQQRGIIPVVKNSLFLND
ncbi:1,4-dihydroxy-6-naphthoate synthase [Pseudoxanthomonas sp. SGD-10]|nr:1,4-dihydroxy-6-naphthoate synthase [Pseudoxanthomonas sp. SGD-10]